MGIQCEHGQLARVCEMCEKDQEIARLREELKDAKRQIGIRDRAIQRRVEIIDRNNAQNRRLREELVASQQREREALAMLLKCEKHSGVADANFGPAKSYERVKTPALVDMLSRAREQEDNSTTGGE